MNHRMPARRRQNLVLALIVNLSFAPIIAASPKPANQPQKIGFQLTIDNIMRGPGLVGYEPRRVRWSGDSQHIYFEWKQASDPINKDYDTYVVGRDGSGLKKLSEAEAKDAAPFDGQMSKDKKLKVYAREGDIFIYDNATGRHRQITSTAEIESDPNFTPDGHHIYFTRSSNLYVLGLDDASLVQMTDIRTGGAPAEPARGPGGQARRAESSSEQKGTESQEYIKKEERDLLDVVKERAAKREEDEAKRKRENPRKPFNLQAGQSVQYLQLAPDGKRVIAGIVTAGQGAKNTIVPNYVTESSYTEDIPGRTKVGDVQQSIRVALIDAHSGEVSWVDYSELPKSTAPAVVKEKVTASEAKAEASSKTTAAADQTGAEKEGQGTETGHNSGEHRPPKPVGREISLLRPIWSDDGSRALMMARAADNKDRWILSLDPATGKTSIITSDHDDAWVDGPGSFTLGWLPDNEHIYFQSERDGYSHLYTCSASGAELKQLTSGKWEVTSARLSEDKKDFVLTTSEASPAEHHIYTMGIAGGPRTRLTVAAGNDDGVVSPDLKMLAFVHSYTNQPPELFIQESRPGATAKKVTTSPAPDFFGYNWIDPQIVTITARDGATVYGKLFKPRNFKPGGPAVIFVHGAGYLQDVHRGWSGNYFREYMFHHLLMENGYTVLEVDYRGSAGYGRDWRTGIYRFMGGKDLDDNVDAARWLVREHGVDASRIGLYGGSYGGFITLMALFTTPDVFAAGAALRPVTDWAHYNHPYTSDILNLPQTDPEAYKKSSPIYFANGLKGALLICHGMADTNVHFQDTVRLIQRLIELRKENWQVAVYPVEDHGFVEPTSWADEYKRIFKLFETNLKGPRKDQSPNAAGSGR